MNKQHTHSELETKGYFIIKKIGEGQFGHVYLAKDKNDRQVAIKMIKKSDLRKSNKRQQLFQTQKAIMSRVNNQNVIKLYDSLQTDEFQVLIMEYCNNGDLYYHIKNKYRGCLSQSQAISILIQILNGFKGLHQHMILHRDVKLKNIMVNNTIIKIADFGLSKFGSKTTTILGSPIVKAPEVFSKKSYDNKVDIWSLGIIFYQMLFKLKYPFIANTEDQLFSKIIGGAKINFHQQGVCISAQTQDLLQKMLTIDPQTRINWKTINQHPAIKNNLKKHQDQNNNTQLSLQYYQKMQQHINRYHCLKMDINQYYQCLIKLLSLTTYQPKTFKKINILYFQFLLCKQMRWSIKTLKQALQKCLQISKIDCHFQQQQITQYQNQIQCYFSQSLINLQLFLFQHSNNDVEITNEILKQETDPSLLKKFSLKMVRILEEKIDSFNGALNIQKIITQTIQTILMLFIDIEDNAIPNTIQDIKQMIFDLRNKVSSQ